MLTTCYETAGPREPTPGVRFFSLAPSFHCENSVIQRVTSISDALGRTFIDRKPQLKSVLQQMDKRP
ncbi:hypothetical protein TNIN_132101 [Trichonephila inaurata madagascariensis]|uniref:Uncharacterized protein n=1 Tax=Trichonephila inaurata madagascariensis TaxID=2747483 RepID=A0A8X7BZZ8_9ARAC|nr:hypothetical protein TNIN_132101 [Trichonephila inaurata madagascariensis]